MQLKIKALLLGIIISFVAKAQTYDFNGAKYVDKHSIQAITENNEIKGYYVFYFLEKESKKKNVYSLEILDNSLKQAYAVKVSKPKKYILLESSYNGERFCFSFLEPKKKMVEYSLYDKTGKAAGHYTVQISKYERANYMSSQTSEGEYFNGGLIAAKDKGFIRLGTTDKKGMRVEITMINNAGKKVWTANSDVKTKKSYETINSFYADDKVFIAGLSTRDGLFAAKDTKFNCVCWNLETGKENFRLSSKTNKYQLYPYGATHNPEGNSYFIYGQYFDEGDNMFKADARGFYIQEVNAQGTVIMQSFTEWEGTILPILVKKSGGKIERNMKTFVHKIVRTADGKLFAIAEQYRKAVSGIGVAMNVLSGGRGETSVVKVEIHDMLVFEFVDGIKFKDVTIFEKKTSNVLLPKGWGTVDANILGYMMKVYGYFDYEFTVISPDRKLFNATYLDYSREKGSDLTAGNISYNKQQKLVIDRVKLSSNPTTTGVVEAKPGYVAIFEYYRKEKRGLLRLEKLNL